MSNTHIHSYGKKKSKIESKRASFNENCKNEYTKITVATSFVVEKNVEFKRFRQQKKLIYFLMMSMLIPFLAATTTTTTAATILYQLIERKKNSFFNSHCESTEKYN